MKRNEFPFEIASEETPMRTMAGCGWHCKWLGSKPRGSEKGSESQRELERGRWREMERERERARQRKKEKDRKEAPN